MKRWVMLLAAVTLSACSGSGLTKPDAQVDPNTFPSNYKSDMLSLLQNNLNDPTNIRDAFVAPPVLKQFDLQSRYVVCVRYNPKDELHKYMGNMEKAAIYFGGRVNQFVDSTPALCAGAAYQAFPELQTLKHLN